MKQVKLIYTVIVCVIILSTSMGIAEDREQKLYTLHPLVGNVIDAEENEKYNLFGSIEGFIVAKVYEHINIEKNKRDYFLHLLGSTEKGGFLVARKLNNEEVGKLEIFLNCFEEKPYLIEQHSQDAPIIPLSKTVLKSIGRVLSIKLLNDSGLVGTIAHATADTIYLKKLRFPIPDSMIKEVYLASYKGKFPIQPMTFPVSGIGESVINSLGKSKHIRLWFGPDLKDAIRFQRKQIAWTVLADSLVLTGSEDVKLPSKSLIQIDVGKKNRVRGIATGLLIGSIPTVITFAALSGGEGSIPQEYNALLAAIVYGSPLIGGIIGGIAGGSVS